MVGDVLALILEVGIVVFFCFVSWVAGYADGYHDGRTGKPFGGDE